MSDSKYQELLESREQNASDEAVQGPLELSLYPDPVLREPTLAVAEIDDRIRSLAEDMVETMYNAQGVGLAAPQVHESIKMIVVDAFQDGREATVALNPEIVAFSGYAKGEEGCLSIPGYRADVERAEKVTVRYMDLNGDLQEKEFEDFEAIVYQHEIDHINGILFPDRLGRLKRTEFLRKMGLEKRKYVRPQSLAEK